MLRKQIQPPTNPVLLSVILVLTCALAGASRLPVARRFKREESKCERIKIPACMEVGYNFTNMKLSPANMADQDDAAPAMKEFAILIDSRCAEEIRLLVCSIYTPICLDSYPMFLPPCRHVCERARRGCAPLLARYNVLWPELLGCEQFPEYTGKNQLCLHSNQSATKSGGAPEYPPPLTATIDLDVPRISLSTSTNASILEDRRGFCTCNSPLIVLHDVNDPHFNKITTGGVLNCGFPCKVFYFDDEEINFFMTWITTCSITCFIVTLLTVGTFLIDMKRFKYPERPIAFISICYLFVSIGFLIRLVAGHEAVACNWRSDRVLHHTTGPFLCSAVFLLVYYFGMAGSLWWVTLTLAWLMAAGMKWGNEAISSRSKYFHMVSWFVPGLQSIMVLATASLSGDALTGICYVGDHDTKALDRFVIAPLTFYLGLGGFFLLIGFINLLRIRSLMKNVGRVTQALDKLIGRIGFYSLVHLALSASLVACHYYDLRNKEKWLAAYNCKSLDYNDFTRPSLTMSVVKHSVPLLIGIANGWWICSKKTVSSWKNFYLQTGHSIGGPDAVAAWLKRKTNTKIQKQKKRSIEKENGYFKCAPLNNLKLTARNNASSRDDVMICG